ncbi:hypothetical protein [Zunongwangia sp.]|uniref:hypothetical protein n=1 Tax=Zunongwangia sp. TaxID=1965325 RepID=UPI003AA821DA
MIERLEIIRKREGMNKAEFERKLLKSSGYLNMLKKRNSYPSAEVIANFSRAFPKYNLKWLLTNEGSMLENTKNCPIDYSPQLTNKNYPEIYVMIESILSNQKKLFDSIKNLEKSFQFFSENHNSNY